MPSADLDYSGGDVVKRHLPSGGGQRRFLSSVLLTLQHVIDSLCSCYLPESR